MNPIYTTFADFAKAISPARAGQRIRVYGREWIRTCANGRYWGWVALDTGEWLTVSQIEYHLMRGGEVEVVKN